MQPCRWQVVLHEQRYWTKWTLEVPSHLSHPGTLWYHDSGELVSLLPYLDKTVFQTGYGEKKHFHMIWMDITSHTREDDNQRCYKNNSGAVVAGAATLTRIWQRPGLSQTPDKDGLDTSQLLLSASWPRPLCLPLSCVCPQLGRMATVQTWLGYKLSSAGYLSWSQPWEQQWGTLPLDQQAFQGNYFGSNKQPLLPLEIGLFLQDILE